jgi:protocatechuate 4,5-dioxygenase, beta chain
MARIIGGFTTSHVPAIGAAIAKGKQNEPYWRPFFDFFPPVRDWIAREKPDVAVIFCNDHGLGHFLDKMPTFAIGCAPEYRHADEGWGLPDEGLFQGDAKLSWHIAEKLVADEFDITTAQEMLVDHAFKIPLQLIYPDMKDFPLRTVPITINSIQHPLPTPKRCWDLGRAVGRAIRSFPGDAKVLLIGSGGLSHQLDGERAGFLNKPFDLWCMDRMIDDPQALTRLSVRDIIEKAGAQGVELETWIAMRGAMEGAVKTLHRGYHIPISNTAAACMLMTPEPGAVAAAA